MPDRAQGSGKQDLPLGPRLDRLPLGYQFFYRPVPATRNSACQGTMLSYATPRRSARRAY